MTGKDLRDGPGSLAQLQEQIASLVRNRLELTSQIRGEQQTMASVVLKKEQLKARKNTLTLAIAERREVLHKYGELIAQAEHAQQRITQIAIQLISTLKVTQTRGADPFTSKLV